MRRRSSTLKYQKEIEMETLQENIFKTVLGIMQIKEFESWLYQESELIERMDEEFIFELFDFNYNQLRALYEFETKFLSYYDVTDFIEWKILCNLERLSIGCDEPEIMLNDFSDLVLDGYSFLSEISYEIFDLEICEYYGRSREELIKEVRDKATIMLNAIRKWQEEKKDEALKEFSYSLQASESKVELQWYESTKDDRSRKTWWSFWK